MEKTSRIGRASVKLIRGDVTDLPVDAFVYYAREDLQLGSGFGTAISTRGGPAVQDELSKLAPAALTDAVVSGAGELKARKIIHAVGPKFQEQDMEDKLRRTMDNVLHTAGRNGIESLALPPMGTGFYGVPLPVSAEIMLASITDFLNNGGAIKEIIICVGDTREYQPFADRLARLGNQHSEVSS
jgi:O-acetyl-ADP-ribose deacetylase (regulator of RNase III)